jgi:hypothetical protein
MPKVKSNTETVVQAETPMPANIIEKLWAEMPTKQRVIAKRGDTVIYGDYIELPQVLRRLQEVYGMNYSIGFAPPAFHENAVIVRAVVVAGDTRVEGFGTATIRNNDIETAVKSAETDAVKRACRYLGIGAFLYEKGLTETNGSNATRNGKPAKANRNGQATAGDEELPRLPSDLRDAVVQAFRNGLSNPNTTFEQGYAYLRKYATPKQASALVRYPDLVEDFCDRVAVVEDNSEVRELVSELVSIAVRRLKERENWRDYYDYEPEEEEYEEYEDEDPFA